MWRSRSPRDRHHHPGKHDQTHNRTHCLSHPLPRKRDYSNCGRGAHERPGRQKEVINAEEIAKMLECPLNGTGREEVDAEQKVERGNREWKGGLIGTCDEGAWSSWSTCKHH